MTTPRSVQVLQIARAISAEAVRRELIERRRLRQPSDPGSRYADVVLPWLLIADRLGYLTTRTDATTTLRDELVVALDRASVSHGDWVEQTVDRILLPIILRHCKTGPSARSGNSCATCGDDEHSTAEHADRIDAIPTDFGSRDQSWMSHQPGREV